MKIALVTTPAGEPSGIGDYTRHLLPYLREHADVELFAEDGREGGDAEGEVRRPVSDLDPRAFDQTLYQLGNERRHAFMLRMLPALGGTVALHDWVLFDAAAAAFPALARGGWRGLRVAFREGGLGQARTWLAARRDAPVGLEEIPPGPPALVDGWHAAEGGGRWTSGHARLRLPPEAERVELELEGAPGASVTLAAGGAEVRWEPTRSHPSRSLVLEAPGGHLTALTVRGARKRGGDPRRLGVFVRRVAWSEGGTERELDLARGPLAPFEGVAAARFRLPLNRAAVRDGDAFCVHSEWIRDRVLAERNAPTPIAVIPHGCERREVGGSRAEARERAGLADWRDDFLVVSFGAVQRHKRVDRLLAAVARANELRPDLRLLLVGRERREELDVDAEVARLGLEGVVRTTGHVPEREVWQALHSADLAVQLRGPSTRGASGGAAQALSLGRAVVMSDLPEHADLPSEACPRVTAGPEEVEALAGLLVELRDDPERRTRMERAARGYVDRVAHWEHVARQYAEALAAFPNARSARRSLVALAFRARTKARAAAR